MNKRVEFLRTDEIAMELGKPRNFIFAEIRKGRLKAVKSGKEYLISRNDLNSYLGIESNDESLKKDLIIKELQARIKSYEIKINTFKGILSTMESIIQV